MSEPKHIVRDIRAQDAMSVAETLTIIVPAYGAGPSPDQLQSALKSANGACTVEEIKAAIDFDCLCEKFGLLVEPHAELTETARPKPLSEESYQLSLANRIIALESQILENNTLEIVSVAILIGRTFEHLKMREKSLKNATRGKKVRDGASKAGDAKRGHKSEEAKRTVRFMRNLVQQGKSISQAAEIAVHKQFGTSKEANRKMFDRYKGKKL